MRRHRAEPVGLITRHREVADRLGTCGDRDGHIAPHVTTIMAPATLLGRGHRHRQRRAQTNGISPIGK